MISFNHYYSRSFFEYFIRKIANCHGLKYKALIKLRSRNQKLLTKLASTKRRSPSALTFTIGGSRNRHKLPDAQATAFIEKPSHGPPPAIFQCTWGPGQKSKVEFPLCASMGCQNFAPKQFGDWKTRLQRSQFDLLMNWNDIKNSVWTD